MSVVFRAPALTEPPVSTPISRSHDEYDPFATLPVLVASCLCRPVVAKAPDANIGPAICLYRRLLREHLTCSVPESFELDCISARVEQKHGCLLARLPLEPDAGLNHEVDARLA